VRETALRNQGRPAPAHCGPNRRSSFGGVQSNHTRMVAATAAKIGMKCRLVQEDWVPLEDAV
jgi:1-aminocyclopropane-1-carboxylate deaminase